MEGVYKTGGSKAPTLNSLSGPVSALNVPPFSHVSSVRYRSHSSSPILDPYASSDSSSKSPLVRYMLSRSPLASIDNLMDTVASPARSVFKSKGNVEEDVFVMDCISVDRKGLRSRSSPLSSGGKSSTGSSSSVSGGGGGRGKENVKDTCQFWKESGFCRFGANCLFQHGNEELRQNLSPHLQSKKKSEAQICKAYTVGSCTYGSKCKFVHAQVKSSTPQALSPIEMNLPTTPEIVCPEESIRQPCFSSNSSTSTLASSDWSPMDDGIEVTLPCAESNENESSRHDVISYIQSVLCGSTGRRRLPVFAEICGE